MHPIVQSLKERKLVQWALAYLAGAWLVWQVMDVLGDRWGLTAGVGRALDMLLIVGLLITLILAWYHGEQGKQRVSGPELLMIGGLFALTAAVLTVFAADGGAAADREVAADSAEAVLGLVPEVVLRDRPAIAVLPFTNMSADAENEYFTQGIHDDILTQLSKIDALDVIARTSVMQYARHSNSRFRILGWSFGVETVVEGGVQRFWKSRSDQRPAHPRPSPTRIFGRRRTIVELTAENVFANPDRDRPVRSQTSLRATLTPAKRDHGFRRLQPGV